MRCKDVRALLADHLDDLLGGTENREIARHLAACEGCAAASRELEVRLAVLYRTDDVPSPPAGLPDRILHAAMPSEGVGYRAFLRYAAVFLLGVGVALAVRPEPRVIEIPVEKVVMVNAAPEETPVDNHDVPRVPRRIR